MWDFVNSIVEFNRYTNSPVANYKGKLYNLPFNMNDYRYGNLEYRTVRFEQETIDKPSYQGNAVVNYTEREIPYTRVIEHKHFEMFGQQVYDCPKTVISKKYSTEWKPGM